MGFSISYEGNVSSKYCLIIFYFSFLLIGVVLFSLLLCLIVSLGLSGSLRL